MAVTTVRLGADKAGDLARALTLMVAQGSIGIAHVAHDDDCPTLTGLSMRSCTCTEVGIEIEPLEVPE